MGVPVNEISSLSDGELIDILDNRTRYDLPYVEAVEKELAIRDALEEGHLPITAEISKSNNTQIPTIGILAVGFGIAAILMPYFAAVFFAPAAVICGIIAYSRLQTSWGVVGIILGIIGLIYIFTVSNQITSLLNNPTGSSPLPQSIFHDAPIVTKSEYNRINDGMSYSQVCSIIGSNGEEMSRSDIGGYTTVMYQWVNSNGSNMNAMFQNGGLVSKAQYGLQ